MSVQEENNTAQNAAEESIAVNRVTVKTPPFWKGDPSIWFAQIEAQFALSGISSDTTKYYHVISAVDTEILTQVTNIIQTPPPTDRYTDIAFD
jgi:hypothetical protein